MRTFLTIASVLLFAPVASADVLSSPPDRCPVGSMGIVCHGAPTCRVAACEDDGDCAPGSRCVERALCIEPHGCGGRIGEPVYDHVIGACAGDTCAAGTCETRRVCIGGAMDAGPIDIDGGPIDTDAGSDPDGGSDSDGGNGTDAGGTGGTDAGTTTSTEDDGGCCSVSGGGSAVTGTLFMVGGYLLLRRRRRR